MKKMFTLLITTAIIGFANAAAIGNDAYTKAMSEGMEALGNAQSPADFLAVGNKFGRIAEVETEKWLPNYYASYSVTVSAAMHQTAETKDDLLDKAQSYLDKIYKVDQYDMSEVQALQGFIYMIRIGVDPASRGQQYSGMSAQALQKSKAANPKNPRTLYMLAQLSAGSAQFFGNDLSEACGINEQALTLFELESGNKERSFAPTWGKQMSLQFQEKCK